MKTDNELIAEFMGHPLYYKQVRHRHGSGVTPPKTKKHKLLYDRSWSWLMPVVEKIAILDFGFWILITINGRNDNRKSACAINRGRKSFEPIAKQQQNKPLIENVYQAVVEFLKWYNENKKHENIGDMAEKLVDAESLKAKIDGLKTGELS